MMRGSGFGEEVSAPSATISGSRRCLTASPLLGVEGEEGPDSCKKTSSPRFVSVSSDTLPGADYTMIITLMPLSHLLGLLRLL